MEFSERNKKSNRRTLFISIKLSAANLKKKIKSRCFIPQENSFIAIN